MRCVPEDSPRRCRPSEDDSRHRPVRREWNISRHWRWIAGWWRGEPTIRWLWSEDEHRWQRNARCRLLRLTEMFECLCSLKSKLFHKLVSVVDSWTFWYLFHWVVSPMLVWETCRCCRVEWSLMCRRLSVSFESLNRRNENETRFNQDL